jgi:hypothetical protein
VARLVSSRAALGITEPDASDTVPERLVVGADCAQRARAERTSREMDFIGVIVTDGTRK